MEKLLIIILENLKLIQELSFFDIFNNRKEIWFNYNNETYKITLEKID